MDTQLSIEDFGGATQAVVVVVSLVWDEFSTSNPSALPVDMSESYGFETDTLIVPGRVRSRSSSTWTNRGGEGAFPEKPADSGVPGPRAHG